MKDLITPLPQSAEFQKACEFLNLPVRRIESAQGSCLVQTRKLPIIGSVNLMSRGPVCHSGGDVRSLIAEARAELRGPLVVNAGAEAEKFGGIKFARGAALAMIDILPPEEARARMHQKWRNQLKKAEKSPLVVVDQALNPHKHQWFLESETRQQKSRGYKSYPAPFLLAFAAANKNQARLYSAQLEGKPVASMLVLKHGRMATYQAGVTTDLGRHHCAHNLLLWRIMSDLHRKGIEQLDLGRADLSTGLRRFKLGAGAREETLPGSFAFFRLFSRRPRAQQGTFQLS